MYGMLTALDDAVGNLTQKLKEVRVYKNTIIIFSSDNGAPSGDGLTERNLPLRGN